MAVPYTFGTATAAIPLSQLDSNFATAITLGNTAVYLGNTTTSIGNLTLTNVTISSGNVTLTNVSVTTANVSGTANITTLVATNDATISGLTVGKGAGAVSTNTAVGASALAANTSGGFNTAVGYQAGSSNTTGGAAITAFGYQAGKANTSGFVSAFGFVALAANTTGANNAAFGAVTLAGNTTGSFNTGIGDNALASNTTASNNTAVGYQAGYSNTTASNCVFVGHQAGYSSATATYNTFFGQAAGYNATGNLNTFIGPNAGYYVTTGSKNTIVGVYSGNQGGLDIRTASNYIVLSDGDGNPRGIFDNSGNLLVGRTSVGQGGTTGVSIEATSPNGGGNVWIANSGTTSSQNPITVYSTGASAYRFYLGMQGQVYATNTTITAISDQRLKENIVDLDVGLDSIMALKPRKFDWKEGKGKDIKGDRGFIAQEFEIVFPDMIEQWLDPAPEGEEPYKAVNANLIPILVKAIQEQQAIITQLQADVAALKGASA